MYNPAVSDVRAMAKSEPLLLEQARAVQPGEHLKSSRYWVGILYHYVDFPTTRDLVESDFLWMKGHKASNDTSLITGEFLNKVFDGLSNVPFIGSQSRDLQAAIRKQSQRPVGETQTLRSQLLRRLTDVKGCRYL